ncbi:SOS response-associated peptidase [Arthrobacter sp. zg-Y820]|uniref:SOS response-associated peptidase n=1 Tax=unclassified Arthrobacter TaxID=235627 RepID=UPI0022B0E6B7|nr:MULTISPECIES: SOS response-associated peptidase [unclassified Arthrobacter]MDK1279220.1 SOS response-associated peptidase [Arthrobacter sp. zg.Y820]WIB08382.1 SOS response-associated peptidase [Arthrobacter sp. zg-Y820]
MCGRYVMAKATSDLVAAFNADQAVGEDLAPSWNVAPTDNVRIVTERARHRPADDDAGRGGGHEDGGGDTVRRLATAKWGLVPVWAKDAKIGARMINARRETVLEKPAFRKAAVKRRALVPADGYYEWEKSGSAKIPTYLYSPAQDPLAFAGLYEFWPDPSLPEDHEHKWLVSFTIITTEASDALGHIHDRTPLIVPPDLYTDWLDPRLTETAEVQQLLDAMPEPVLTPRVVSSEVNSVRNNGPQLVLPAED